MNELIISIGLPIARSVGGWAKKALSDGVIEKYEWTLLVETVLRTGIVSSCVYFGLNGVGVDVDVLASTATAVLIDYFVPKTTKKTN